MSPGFVKTAVILGLLCVIGPFAIDMYLPAMPEIAGDLSVSASATQLTLTAFFLSFGLSQIIYGPWSDMVGRRPPMVFGLVVFSAASLGCYFSPSIEWLIFFRCLQGIGASASMVIPRAIIRDMHTGVEATRLMALVMLVISISPMLAPMIGSLLIIPFGWRSIFLAVLLAAALALVLIWRLLPETLAKADRMPVEVKPTLQAFAKLLRDPYFMGLTFIGGFGISSFFAFLGSASFLYTERYGLSPSQFSIAFAVNAIGFFALSQLAAGFGERFGIERVVRLAVTAYAACAAVLVAATMLGMDSFFGLAAMLFVTYAFLGLVLPTAMVLSLDANGPIAGMASALAGTLHMMLGALVIGVMSVIFDGTPGPMVATIGGCALITFILTQMTLRPTARSLA